ncbi:creatininase [Mesobacillus foraminis]|uniref:creatininase n=1 Tax=Mesobacillus foraminis TaxID=279826 RepID=UPI000EF4B48A|nr:creatininase [Mesobacillus foraminis]
MMRTRKFAELTWKEIQGEIKQDAGIILPIGSTEQHGYHLPLATDAMLAEDLALAAAGQTNMLVAPPVTYGYRSRPLTGGGQSFPGTTSLSGKVLMSMIEDLLCEFMRHGFKKIVLLNWHFENQNFIYEAAYTALERMGKLEGVVDGPKIMVMELSFSELSDDTMDLLFASEFPGWGTEHAAILETSLMLHLHPELVQFEKAVNDQAEQTPWYDVLPIPSKMVPESGTLWKARLADKKKGEAAWREITDNAAASIHNEFSTTVKI